MALSLVRELKTHTVYSNRRFNFGNWAEIIITMAYGAHNSRSSYNFHCVCFKNKYEKELFGDLMRLRDTV